ncbi:MAG: hypothetical protein WBW71_16770 [Bacteroidota bacterium]
MRIQTKSLLTHFSAVLLLFAVHASLTFSQEVSVSTAVDSTHITMGDWLNLTVQVKHADSVNVAWSELKDTLGVFEIIRLDTLQPSEAGGVVTEGRKITLSAYDSGSFVIPPILIAYRQPGDTAGHYLQSDPLTIQVSSVEVDTSKAIKDIKPPLGVPLTWKEIALYAGIILALGALLYGGYWYYRKKKKQAGEIVEVDAPKIPPHIQAMIRLKELKEKRVWEQGDVKAFYSEATEIIRQYFEGRYGIMALELTSDEVFAQLRRFTLEKDVTKLIETFFIDADLVKFAKYTPVPSENEAVIPQALDIVERTKPKEEVPQHV